jgi:hypothetical protein
LAKHKAANNINGVVGNIGNNMPMIPSARDTNPQIISKTRKVLELDSFLVDDSLITYF